MAVLELNTPGTYDVTELTLAMNAPSIIRFKIHTEGADDPGLAVRTKVQFKLPNGRKLFAGRVLPSDRRLSRENDEIEYVAADILEYLAHNPCNEVNEWYNPNNGANFSSYPEGDDVDFRFILETEFASLISDGTLTFDFSLANGRDQITIYEFTTRGLTWLEIIDKLVAEIPALAYFYDPNTVPDEGSDPADGVNGGTIRFYDLSTTPTTGHAEFVIPEEGTENEDVNILALDFKEDIAQSYDRLTLYGWGNLKERERERVSPGWGTPKLGKFAKDSGLASPLYGLMRENPDGGRPQFYVKGSPGTWATVPSAAQGPTYINRWHPEIESQDGQFGMRRFMVEEMKDVTTNVPSDAQYGGVQPNRIVDFRLKGETTGLGDLDTFTEVVPSMSVFSLYHIWETGNISFDHDNGFFIGVILNGVKYVAWTAGVQNDLGDVVLQSNLYPDYPAEPLVPKRELGTPFLFEKHFFYMAEPLVRRTDYMFVTNVTSDPEWNDMVNVPQFAYWPVVGEDRTDPDVWIDYVGSTPFFHSLEDGSLGYDKHLKLYEFRLFRYEDANGDMFRDNHDLLVEYCQMIFATISRPRYTGTVAADFTKRTTSTAGQLDADKLDDYEIGSPVKFINWNGDGEEWTPKTVIQSVRFENLVSDGTATFGFDSDLTARGLNEAKQFRAFNRQNEFSGSGGNGFNGRDGGTPGGQEGAGCGNCHDNGGGGAGGGGGYIEPPDYSRTSWWTTQSPPPDSSSDGGESSSDGGYAYGSSPEPSGGGVGLGEGGDEIIITSAKIMIVPVDETYDDVAALIFAEDIEDTKDFSAVPEVDSRDKTTANVQWAQNELISGTSFIDSPDISPLIQELIDREDWASGNALCVLLEGLDDRNAELIFKAYNDSPSLSAKIEITYTTNGIDPVTITRQLSSGAKDAHEDVGGGNFTSTASVRVLASGGSIRTIAGLVFTNITIPQNIFGGSPAPPSEFGGIGQYDETDAPTLSLFPKRARVI